MAITNKERVSRALDSLRAGLTPFLHRELAAKLGSSWESQIAGRVQVRSSKRGVIHWDVQTLLKAMVDTWREVFEDQLDRYERTLVSELIEIRNRFAHDHTFTSDDTYRALDSVQRLLTAVAATDQAAEVARSKDELQRTVYQDQARSKIRYQVTAEGKPAEGLKPWRDIITPHPDVAQGRYVQAEFAADLAEVHRGDRDGSSEYKDPVEFFRRTFVTAGLKDLLVGALQRLAGEGGDPVVELQTNFGGGKTHSMLALYHLFGGTKSSSLPGVESVLAEAGVAKAPAAKRAVLVGTDLSPGQIHTKQDGTTIRTMWGELAWQLGGKKGYALVADSDQRATSPGSDVLAELFRQHAPVLVLIDEWVAYARQCVGKNDIPAGNFDTQASFAQALTEAAKRAPRTLVVASIPASRIEVGGQNGEHALEALKNVFERVGKAWRPASADEGFEIVRRRLFEPISDADLTKHRDATIREFRNLYRTNAAEFPGDVAEMAYEKKMLAAYPIHPELFARLYGDWSTLDKFQRTRGVLRLLARVINRLWEGGDKSLMIMPCSVPLDDGAVRSELTRYLPDVWEPIITTDVDGPESLPAEIERASPTMARVHAARRVARAIYLGTAPGSDGQNPGIDDRLIKLACAQPGEAPATFGDALRKISDRARHIHQDQNRYWISTKPNLNRMADDRANDLKRDPETLWNEIKQRIRDAHKSKASRGGFEGVHACPDGAVDADDPVVRLVIIGPEHPHKKGDLESAAAKAASALLQSRGAGPRLYQNCLLFLAPERRDLEALMDAVASFLAWKKIHAEQAALNLDEFHRNQAKTKKEELDDTVDQRIAATWQHALIPYQSAPGAAITWDERKVAGDGTLAERAWARLDKDVVFSNFGGANLGMELDKYLWQDKPHVTFGEIADWYARHVYLSRVLNRAVLAKAVEDGSAQTDIRETFATALAWDSVAGRYRGLKIHAAPSSLEATTVIIRPAVAQAQLDKERAEREAVPSGSTDHRSHPDSTPPAVGGRPAAPPPPRPITTYVATAQLDASRVGRDAGKITEEVIQHLSVLPGAEVDIRLEIHIRVPGGIGERIVRVVSENAHALGLAASNFEKD